MIKRNQVREKLKEIFQSETWDGDAILELLKHHEVTPETFLHQLSQIHPGLFKITELQYFRFEHFVGINEIRLTKELNMPKTLVPIGLSLKEHHCRRGLPVSLPKILEEEQLKEYPNKILIRTQRAQFVESGEEVLFISIAHALRLLSKMKRCVSLVLKIDNVLKRKVKFLNDPQIPVEKVNQKCERCPLDNSQCSERTAPPSVCFQKKKEELMYRTLKKLVTDYRAKNLKI